MARSRFIFRARHREIELGHRTQIMGVVNITPDSFSDGGRFLSTEKAVEQAVALVEAGADILDLGGESSRPGATPVSAEEEIRRVIPALESIRSKLDVMISVDTNKAAVAQEALRAGADLVNDISALRSDPAMAPLIAEHRAGAILMHMRGCPRTMQQLPPSQDILREVYEDLQSAVMNALDQGIGRDRIMLDPGIGFGKTLEDNLRIMNRLGFLNALEFPLLIGPSRKRFLGTILNLPVEQRVYGTAAAVTASVLKGVHVVRVHDVREILQVVRVVDSIASETLVQ